MKIKIDNINYNIDIIKSINSKTVTIKPTILQQCNSLGIKIPRFCYHEALSIAGNCRMCLVEKENTLKPIASCAINISDNLVFFTKSAFVKKTRENVLEFLLINHPLDCPICDQGGECDLQDQSVLYGNDRSRYNESKRSVIDKSCGIFIKTIMTRCIHCTRCVRFLNEITGSSFFGVIGRGSKMEISTYLLNKIKTFNEFSGNIIDICPVGALTSKPYSFNSRSWELLKFAGINIVDPLGSYFSIHFKNNKIYRILPYLETLDSLIIEWIPDNIRFFYDGLMDQRVKKPFLYFKKKNFFISIYRILKIYKISLGIFKKLKKNFFFNFFLDNTNDFFFLKLLKIFILNMKYYNLYLGKNLSKKNVFLKNTFRSNFFFSDIFKILKENENILILFGLNPRIEFFHLNLYFRKIFLKEKINKIVIFSFNSNILLNFEYKSITNNLKIFLNFFCFKTKFSNILSKKLLSKKIYFFLGKQIFFDNNLIFENIIKKICFFYFHHLNNYTICYYYIFKELFFYNILELNLFEKFYNKLLEKKRGVNINFIMNNNKKEYKKKIKKINNFNFFFSAIGHNFMNLEEFNCIIPISIYLEKSTGFINFFGILKKIKGSILFYNMYSLKYFFMNFLYFFISNYKLILKKYFKNFKLKNNLYIFNFNFYQLYIYIYGFKNYFLNLIIDTTKYFFKNTVFEKNSLNLKNNLNFFKKNLNKNFNINHNIINY